MGLELLDTFPSGLPQGVMETVVLETVVLVKVLETVVLVKVVKQRVVVRG